MKSAQAVLSAANQYYGVKPDTKPDSATAKKARVMACAVYFSMRVAIIAQELRPDFSFLEIVTGMNASRMLGNEYERDSQSICKILDKEAA